MPSSSANPTLTTSRIPPQGSHPAHPAVNPPADQPFTLLVNPSNPLTYSITFFNSGTDQSVRIYLMAFLSSQPSNPIWSDASLTCPPNFQPPYNNTVGFYKASLGNADTLWIGSWWNDGTYATAQDYFAAHPEGGGHHTVPILIG
jgi:hypothetical protein